MAYVFSLHPHGTPCFARGERADSLRTCKVRLPSPLRSEVSVSLARDWRRLNGGRAFGPPSTPPGARCLWPSVQCPLNLRGYVYVHELGGKADAQARAASPASMRFTQKRKNSCTHGHSTRRTVSYLLPTVPGVPKSFSTWTRPL